MMREINTFEPDLQWIAHEKFPLWEARGADGKELMGVCSRTGSLLKGADSRGGWTYDLMSTGGKWLGESRSPAHAKMKDRLFRKASVYYGIAKYPFIDSILKRDAYSRQRAALSDGRKYFPYAVEQVKIPFMDADIIGRFASPRPRKEITLPEAVLLTGDIDMAKEDLQDIENSILDSGMACLSIDLPGTGESAWKLSESSGDVYAMAIKYLAARGDIDVNRIGVFGLGMGGYWAVLSASKFQEVKGAVNCSGPVYRSFDPENLVKLPDFWKKTLAFVQGLDPNKPEDVQKGMDNMPEYSLLREDRLQDVTCPILSIGGSSDPVTTVDDLFALREDCGIDQEEWVYREDGHCAAHHYKEWMPRAVRWLANTLGGKERIPAPDLARL
jgi:2,6-dihydroxypseudooxynicotine hydrolase